MLLSLLPNALLCALFWGHLLLALGEQEGQETQISRLPALAGGRVPGVEEGVGLEFCPRPFCGAWEGRSSLLLLLSSVACAQGRLVVLSFLPFWRHC